MCDECEEFPAQYVAYFNKAGGKLWRPAQKAASTPWAIDIRPTEPRPYAPPPAGEGRVVLSEVRRTGSARVPPALRNDSASAMRGSFDGPGEAPALLGGGASSPSTRKLEELKGTVETPALPVSCFRCEETRS